VTSSVKVLCIGDQDESSRPKNNTAKHAQHNFEEDFKAHLRLLIVGTPSPVGIVEDWNKVQMFGAASIKEGNQPRRYQFYGATGYNFPVPTIISGPTFNARPVMNEVKRLLRDENWVADNVIEAPIRAKECKEYYNSDSYIQHIVFLALGSETTRLYWYIRNLHKEHVKK
ncbi:hypothetical protein KR222_011726, partial [Zaprionus bogoriensis]